jgi:hypothetical protein
MKILRNLFRGTAVTGGAMMGAGFIDANTMIELIGLMITLIGVVGDTVVRVIEAQKK